MFKFLSKVEQYVGPTAQGEQPLPVGRSRVSTRKPLGIAFISAPNDVLSMFVLEPGTHTVLTPKDVMVLTECDKDNKWHVIHPGRFERSDPTRIDVALVRPRSQREEMQDYVNELIARTQTGHTQQMLRSGQAVIDTTQDDYNDDDDDHDSPLSIHQMSLIMDEIQADIQAARVKSAPAKPISNHGPGNNVSDLQPGATGVNENDSQQNSS